MSSQARGLNSTSLCDYVISSSESDDDSGRKEAVKDYEEKSVRNNVEEKKGTTNLSDNCDSVSKSDKRVKYRERSRSESAEQEDKHEISRSVDKHKKRNRNNDCDDDPRRNDRHDDNRLEQNDRRDRRDWDYGRRYNDNRNKRRDHQDRGRYYGRNRRNDDDNDGWRSRSDRQRGGRFNFDSRTNDRPLKPPPSNTFETKSMKLKEQVEKRKLMWQQGNKDKKVAEHWSAMLATCHDEKQMDKLKKLIGIHGDDPSALEQHMKQLTKQSIFSTVSTNTVGEASTSEATAPVSSQTASLAVDARRQQEELFNKLNYQYEMGRMSTHTHRGVGLGFSSQANEYATMIAQQQQHQLQSQLYRKT